MGHAALREPSNQYTAFTHLPRTCMRGNHARRRRQAIPNRRRPDLGVCVQSLNCVPRTLAARPTGVAADRKVRGSRKRGYRKPGRKSGCPVPPFAPRPGRGASPAAARQHLSPPRDWGQPRLLRPRPQERRNRSSSPPEGKRLVPAGGTISASCVCAAGTAGDFALSLGERITRLPRREIEVAFSRYMWYNKSI